MWETEIEQAKAHARTANKLIEQLTSQLALYSPFENCDERMLVALPLLKSSIDVAAAATRLLTIDPVQFGSAAETMFRPQLERYMRAVFFGSPMLTDDSEVHAFFEGDAMPKRQDPNHPKSKPRPISFDALTRDVSSEIVRQTGRQDAAIAQAFARAVALEKDDLHGAVHGGKIVVRRYLTDYLAHNPWALAQGKSIEAMLLVSLLALSQVAHLHGGRSSSAKFRLTPEFDALLREKFPNIPPSHA